MKVNGMDDMDDTEHPGSGPSVLAKPRISYACEACRGAKVRCQRGDIEGICRRYAFMFSYLHLKKQLCNGP